MDYAASLMHASYGCIR